MGEVKIMRCPEECGKQWRPVQSKLGWEKQKDEEAKEEVEKRKEEKGKNSGSKESSGGMGDMGGRRGSSKVRSRSNKVGAKEVSPMDKGIRKEEVRKDADKEGVGSCDRCKEGVCSEKGKDVPIVKRREREGEGVY